MDPENTTMRVRLAEVYVRLGKKNDAWQIFSAAAETLRSKGNLPGAEEVLQRMLTLAIRSQPQDMANCCRDGGARTPSRLATTLIAEEGRCSDLDRRPSRCRRPGRPRPALADPRLRIGSGAGRSPASQRSAAVSSRSSSSLMGGSVVASLRASPSSRTHRKEANSPPIAPAPTIAIISYSSSILARASPRALTEPPRQTRGPGSVRSRSPSSHHVLRLELPLVLAPVTKRCRGGVDVARAERIDLVLAEEKRTPLTARRRRGNARSPS